MKVWIKKIFGFGLTSFFGDFSHEMTFSLIPLIVTQLVGEGRAPLFLGIITSLPLLCASFLRLISGLMTDRYDIKKPLMVLGYSMSALFSALTGFAHSMLTIGIYQTLAFAGSGLREPPRDTLIAATVEPRYLGRAFGLKSAMDTAGALIGPLVALALTPYVSLQTIFLISLIPGILSVASIFLFIEDVPTRTSNTATTKISLLKNITQLPRPFLLFVIILFIFYLGNFNKLLLLTRAQEIIAIPKQSIAWTLIFLYAFLNFIRALSEFCIGLLSDYTNRITLLALLGCGLFAITNFLLITPQASFFYCACVFALNGISLATVAALKPTCATYLLPLSYRGLGYGTLQASEGIATLFCNIFVGFLWTHYSPLISFSFAITTSCIAACLLLYFKNVIFFHTDGL